MKYLGKKTDGKDAATQTDLQDALAGKVDKETGKGLSTEDFTAEEKAKLAGIEAGAGKNGRNRGTYDNAFASRGNWFSIDPDEIYIVTAGYGYQTGERAETAEGDLFEVTGVGDMGDVTSVKLLVSARRKLYVDENGGLYLPENVLPTTVLPNLGYQGSGLLLSVNFTQEPFSTISSIDSPHEGDYAYVNEDETHGGETWRYDWSDPDGDGRHWWTATIRINDVPRDFQTSPVRTAEIADAAVTMVKLETKIQTLLDFIGSQKVTTLVNIPVTKSVVYANIASNQALSMNGQVPQGRCIHVLVKNTSSEQQVTVAIPNAGTYSPDNETSLTLNALGRAELNVLYDSNEGLTKIIVRA
jgi:hypothetical protein